jgi:predicted lipoprotein with Yx(FWY)xxD motif
MAAVWYNSLMKRNLIYIVVVIVVAAAVWAIWGMQQKVAAPATATPPEQTAATGSPAAKAPSAAAPSVAVPPSPAASAYFNQRTSPTLGTYLTDASGMTLYTYAKDTTGVSNCTGGCLTAWPPYGPGISASGTFNMPMLPANVNTITGNDGMVQFTWKGMPLYYFAEDKAPGDTTGQGVGGIWFVVKL